MTRRIAISVGLLALVLASLSASGCGSSGGDVTFSKPPDYERLLAGSPAPLAALHAQENELLAGGLDAYEKRLAELRGYPVVANVWASWCNPCRVEFPVLQKLAARYGKQVAFLGVDSEDDPEFAERFLASAPVPYPSYSDAGGEIKESVGGRGLPTTVYYNREGEVCFVKQGPYPETAELEADVRRFALREECESG